MRIISNVHDYYDGVQAEGQDLSLVYNRRQETTDVYGCFENDIKATDNIPYLHDKALYNYRQLPMVHIWQYAIGFCDKVYPVIKISRDLTPALTCHTFEEADKFIRENTKKQELENYLKRKSKVGWRTTGIGRHWHYYQHQCDIAHYFEKFAERQNSFKHLFDKYKCPVFVIEYGGGLHDNHKLTVNAILKPFEFYKVFDAYSAFQEIAMYLGGKASPEKPIPAIDDVTMAEAKGFDKWSFRKEPRRADTK